MRRRFRKYAKRRRRRRSFLQYLAFILLMVIVAWLLRFLFSIYDYMPTFYEPKDFEREKAIEKKK